MPATTYDLYTDPEAVRRELEQETTENHVFRNAFEQENLADAQSKSVKFRIYEDTDRDIEIVPEAAEFPRDMSNAREVTVSRDKYGEEYGLTLEDQMDGVYNDLEREADSKMRRMARRMDNAAWAVLSQNLNSHLVVDNDVYNPNTDTVPDGDGTLTYEDIVTAHTTLLDAPNQYAPDTIYVGPMGLRDLLTQDVLTHSTEAGDDRIETGEVGPIAGIGTVYVSNTGALGRGEAIVVDSSAYGIEGVWQDVDTRVYADESRQIEEIMQMWGFFGWGAARPDAAMYVQS